MSDTRNDLYTTGTTEYREDENDVSEAESGNGTEGVSVPEVEAPAETEAESGTSFATYTDPGSITVAAIESAWRAIQERHSEVPDVVVVSGGGTETRRGQVLVTWGHFHPEQWDTHGGQRHELLVSGECLGRGALFTLTTVLHEAAHALNYAREIKDTSRRGKYHNKRFISAANELGMIWPDEAKPHVTTGFSDVQLTDETAEAYADVLDVLETGRRAWRTLVSPDEVESTEEGDEGAESPAKRKRSTNTKPKAECGCGPERAIWASRRVLDALTVACGECGQLYRPVDLDEGE